MENPTMLLAFGAGILSFLTPCCLPIYPSFLSYITGVSINEISEGKQVVRARVLQHSLAFFVGFSTIYVALGLAASALGSFFMTGRSWLPIVGGIWVAVMGLALMGFLRIPFFMRDRRVQFARKPQGLLGTAAVGLAFAAGWTPCIGPILGGVLAMAAANPGYGGLLLLIFSIGFAIPFILLAYSLSTVRWLSRYSHVVEKVGGGIMVAMGLMLALGYMEVLSAWLNLFVFDLTGFTGF